MASRALQNADQIARENVGFADGVLRAKEGPCGWQREQMSQSTVNDKRASGVASPSSDRRTLVASGGIPPGSPPASLDKKSLVSDFSQRAAQASKFFFFFFFFFFAFCCLGLGGG